jgi:hypothetical protein
VGKQLCTPCIQVAEAAEAQAIVDNQRTKLAGLRKDERE